MATASQRTKPLGLFSGQAAPRLYDHLVAVLRVRHDSRRTEEAYVNSTGRFIHVLNRGGWGVHRPADGLARCADERWAETAYHARHAVTMTQPLAVTRLTTIDDLRDRL